MAVDRSYIEKEDNSIAVYIMKWYPPTDKNRQGDGSKAMQGRTMNQHCIFQYIINIYAFPLNCLILFKVYCTRLKSGKRPFQAAQLR